MCNLERLNEGPEKDSNGVTLPQYFYQPSCSEEAQETDVDCSRLPLLEFNFS